MSNERIDNFSKNDGSFLPPIPGINAARASDQLGALLHNAKQNTASASSLLAQTPTNRQQTQNAAFNDGYNKGYAKAEEKVKKDANEKIAELKQINSLLEADLSKNKEQREQFRKHNEILKTQNSAIKYENDSLKQDYNSIKRDYDQSKDKLTVEKKNNDEWKEKYNQLLEKYNQLLDYSNKDINEKDKIIEEKSKEIESINKRLEISQQDYLEKDKLNALQIVQIAELVTEAEQTKISHSNEISQKEEAIKRKVERINELVEEANQAKKDHDDEILLKDKRIIEMTAELESKSQELEKVAQMIPLISEEINGAAATIKVLQEMFSEQYQEREGGVELTSSTSSSGARIFSPTRPYISSGKATPVLETFDGIGNEPNLNESGLDLSEVNLDKKENKPSPQVLYDMSSLKDAKTNYQNNNVNMRLFDDDDQNVHSHDPNCDSVEEKKTNHPTPESDTNGDQTKKFTFDNQQQVFDTANNVKIVEEDQETKRKGEQLKKEKEAHESLKTNHHTRIGEKFVSSRILGRGNGSTGRGAKFLARSNSANNTILAQNPSDKDVFSDDNRFRDMVTSSSDIQTNARQIIDEKEQQGGTRVSIVEERKRMFLSSGK